MNFRPLMSVRLTTSATEEIGSTPQGNLSIFPVSGGSFLLGRGTRPTETAGNN